MNTQTVTVRRILAASCEEVFDAWLDPAGMREWMRPPTVISCDATLDPRVGGRFAITMYAPEGQIVNSGEIRVLERPRRLQFTWVSSRWGAGETLVTVELRPMEGHCELVLTHERFPADRSAAELTGGWGKILEELARHVG